MLYDFSVCIVFTVLSVYYNANGDHFQISDSPISYWAAFYCSTKVYGKHNNEVYLPLTYHTESLPKAL